MAVINLRTKTRPTRGSIARRPGHIASAAAVVIVVAGALAGCGTAAAPSPSTGSPSSHAATAKATAKATLSIKVADKANGTVTHWTLRCDPPGGTTPDPAAACKALFGAKDAFTLPRRHIMCPMIMVSGKQITLDGSWFGKKVHRVIIDGGCDLPIFNSLAKTFN